MRKHLPELTYFIEKIIPGFKHYAIKESIGSGNNALVFKAYSDEAKNIIACKVIPKKNLIGADEGKETWKQEIHKANSLSSNIVVRFFHIAPWIDESENIDCVVLCCDFIKGDNLEAYIRKHKNDISLDFCEQYLAEMLSLIYDMEKNGVKHGDLHSKNVLVEDRSDQLEGANFAFRVTDFGVASATSDANFKDDFEQVAAVLRELLKNVNYQMASPRDKYAFNILNDEFISRHLTETDITRDHLARNAQELHRKLKRIANDFNNKQKRLNQVELLTPFDYLSCEHFGDSHSLLKSLYSDHFLGIQEIESKNNLVLTGPRGCGKSTVYKSLSLLHRYYIDDDLPKDIKYVGIYYRCDDLYSAFSRYELPERKEAYDLPVHFMSVTLLTEILNVVQNWSQKYFSSEFNKLEANISKLIWEALDLNKPTSPGVNTFNAITFRLQKERKRSADKQRMVHDLKISIGSYFGPHVLPNICKIIRDNLSYLFDIPFYFFIDDYSAPKITADLQKNLNRLIMQRTPVGFFKISTESPVSYMRSDIDGKSYVEGREFKLLNLSLVYLAASSEQKRNFIDDIFQRRFASIKEYPVKDLDELLGDMPLKPSTQQAISIREGEKNEIGGKQCLYELCSGDIFYIISLVGKMVIDIGGDEGLRRIDIIPKIPITKQTSAIREEAGNFLNSVRGMKDGEHLVAVVTAFGNVAHSFLKFKNSKNEGQNPPHLASRIEPYEQLKLNKEASYIYTELLRYSLFIEDPRGKSRRGNVVPRLYLRRALLPHFKLTFSKRDSIELEAYEVEQLLLDPEKFDKEHQLSSSSKIEDDKQMQFGDLPKGD